MVRHTASLISANERRNREGAARTLAKARDAIPVLEAEEPATGRAAAAKERHLEVLDMRVAYPEDSMAQLADRMGVTKATYWSELRRALLRADRIKKSANNTEENTNVRTA